jgi:hypothetical protein
VLVLGDELSEELSVPVGAGASLLAAESDCIGTGCGGGPTADSDGCGDGGAVFGGTGCCGCGADAKLTFDEGVGGEEGPVCGAVAGFWGVTESFGCEASGGKLADIAHKKGYPLALLPKVEQPRFGALSSLKALVTVLEKAGLVVEDNAEASLHDAAVFLKNEVLSWRSDVPTSQNPAKQLALEVAGTTPVIYGGSFLFL